MKYLNILCTFGFTILMVSCSESVRISGKKDTGSNYQIRIRPHGSPDSAVISGIITVKDAPAGYSPITRSLTVNKQKVVMADSTGHFEFKLPPGQYTVHAGAHFIANIGTKPFRVKRGDRVNINFDLFSEPTYFDHKY